MTALCIKSIRHFYSNIQTIYVVYDDMACASWPNYHDDATDYYNNIGFGPIVLKRFTEIHPEISRCNVGWWRQQLVKLSVDLLLPEDEWLVIDGDVIFDERIHIEKITPVHVRGDDVNPLTVMVSRYVDTFLGKEHSRVRARNLPTITSSIPFRWLDRAGLSSLRQHVHDILGEDFFVAHTRRFRECEIVGFVPEGDKLVMHEWELWEAYNHLTRSGQYQIVETGSGYHTMTHTSFCAPGYRFRHSSCQDAEITHQWLQQQSIPVPDHLWAKAVEYNQRTRNV
jgi:hypothetical protein